VPRPAAIAQPAADLAAEADGRRQRREQNREAVIDALLALFREGVYQPGSAEIAARAGLSPRSLFRYFDDVDDLHRAAAARQVRLALPLLTLTVRPADPTPAKIDGVVRARVRLFEQIAPAARALRVSAYRHDPLAVELARNRSFLRAQLREVFGPELAAAGELALPAIDVLCSFESYELLRRDQGLSRARLVATLAAALGALLTGGPDA
jgi:TetR/AcrR family transcriptional regulator, regulator of autoinduction and epiphytic fitness